MTTLQTNRGCNDCAANPCQCPHQEGRYFLLLIPLVLIGGVVASMLTGCGVTARDAVTSGRDRWRAATGLTLPVAGISESWGTFSCGDQPTVTGCYNHNTGAITIDVARPEAAVRRTGAHEWGHRLGGPEGGRGILGPQESTPTSDCITTYDVDVVCALSAEPCRWESPECR